MRKGLEFPKIDESKLEEIKNLIDIIAEKGIDDCSEELTSLNSITGKKYEGVEFAEYWGWIDLDTLAKKVLMPLPKKIDLTEEEIREVVENILDNDEAEMDYWLEFLSINTGLDNLSDYIFYPDRVGLHDEASLIEIADKIIIDKR